MKVIPARDIKPGDLFVVTTTHPNADIEFVVRCDDDHIMWEKLTNGIATDICLALSCERFITAGKRVYKYGVIDCIHKGIRHEIWTGHDEEHDDRRYDRKYYFEFKLITA